MLLVMVECKRMRYRYSLALTVLAAVFTNDLRRLRRPPPTVYVVDGPVNVVYPVPIQSSNTCGSGYRNVDYQCSESELLDAIESLLNNKVCPYSPLIPAVPVIGTCSESELLDAIEKIVNSNHKRRSLCILAVLNTLCAVGVIVVMTVHYDEDFWAHLDDPYESPTHGKTWGMVRKSVLPVGVLYIIFAMTGVIGAYNEHYNITMVYGVMSTILAGTIYIASYTFAINYI
ncbi:unnamed protein product [Oppiella nova]|uniref:Uncharacterized protein n=1 Tax=Oppiella nova TaxID=334625 RepID=A0A7R9M9E4_9ACAR|nr:unnamed protein product [Oppiella nova]CAG2173104.1 unnamed protein product [Oppiella nova]